MLQSVGGRNTRVIDLILDPTALESLPELAISFRDKDFARLDFKGIQVDVLLATNKLFKLVRAKHSRSLTIGSRAIPCATPQGLLLLKLFALPSLYRQGDGVRAAIYEADIAGLLAQTGVDAEAAFAQLEPHLLATDIAELRRILQDLGQRGSGFTYQSKIRNPKFRSFLWCWGCRRLSGGRRGSRHRGRARSP